MAARAATAILPLLCPAAAGEAAAPQAAAAGWAFQRLGASSWSQLGGSLAGTGDARLIALVGIPVVLLLAQLLLVCLSHAFPKARDYTFCGGAKAPERLKVFAKWAHQQIEESSPEQHRQLLDEVIYSFATYAQRLEQGTSRGVRRAAELRLRVLIELLETTTVNSALRAANWAWVRDWDKGLLDQREARMRCTVVFPTICAAERVQRAGRPSRRRDYGPSSPQNLTYLAAWCADFLNRPDVRQFLGLGGVGLMAATMGGSGFEAAGALYSDSSDEEEIESPQPRGRAPAFLKDDGKVTGEVDGPGRALWEFHRRTFDGEENSWDEADATQALVRGERYLEDHRKVPSKPCMLELVEVDLLKTADEMVHYGKSSRGKLPKLRAAGDDRFLFIINFRLPPIQLVIIWAVPKDPEWWDQPEGRLFQNFVNMTDKERSERLKVLPKVVEGPWLVKKGVPDRPGVVGRKLAIDYFSRPDHLEASINCISSPAGRRLVQLLTGAAKHFSMELFMILEGHKPEELPERILAGIALYHGEMARIPTR